MKTVETQTEPQTAPIEVTISSSSSESSLSSEEESSSDESEVEILGVTTKEDKIGPVVNLEDAEDANT